jgi:hypothetical protein
MAAYPHIASHRIASHRIASHRISSHRIARTTYALMSECILSQQRFNARLLPHANSQHLANYSSKYAPYLAEQLFSVHHEICMKTEIFNAKV